PLAGLEPARCFHHLILSQARLPIPPQGHGARIIAAGFARSTQKCRLREGRQRDAESLCARLAPQALALLERVSVALNQSGALSPGSSHRPPSLPSPAREVGKGAMITREAVSKGNLKSCMACRH